MPTITYVPQESGDPFVTTLHGLTLKANVPVDVTGKFAEIEEAVKEQGEGGRLVSKTVTRRVPLAEVARGNRSFMVDGEAVVKRGPGRPRVPKDDTQYRAYALAWIGEAEDADVMAARWAAEQELREKCGCGEDDAGYLQPFYAAKHTELANSASFDESPE